VFNDSPPAIFPVSILLIRPLAKEYNGQHVISPFDVRIDLLLNKSCTIFWERKRRAAWFIGTSRSICSSYVYRNSYLDRPVTIFSVSLFRHRSNISSNTLPVKNL